MSKPMLSQVLTANGSTDPIDWPRGPGNFTAQGAFQSGTAQLEFSTDNGLTWNNVPGQEVTHTSGDLGGFDLATMKLRGTLTGASAGANVLIQIDRTGPLFD